MLSISTAISVFDIRDRGSRFIDPMSTNLPSTMMAFACRLTPEDKILRTLPDSDSGTLDRSSLNATPQASNRGL